MTDKKRDGTGGDGTRSDKIPRWADLLLTVWVLVVGVIYFGGYLSPLLGALTPAGAAVYAVMVVVSVLTVTFRLLKRTKPISESEETPTKNRK